MRDKMKYYIDEFIKAPLPMQNIVIRKGIMSVLYLLSFILLMRSANLMSFIIPGTIVFLYILFDFFRTLHICCYEKYSYISGECIQVIEKRHIFGLSGSKGKIDSIKIRYDVSKDITLKVRNQREVSNIEEGMIVEVYIPDYARVYQDMTGIRVDECYYILVKV